MQNNIYKEFENNPNVVTVLVNEGGRFSEDWDWLKEYWSHYYLRGQVVYDPNGNITQTYFKQPTAGFPYGRGFIMDQQGKASIALLGHHPYDIIDVIYDLLERGKKKDRTKLKR